ncbi:MAG: hypothetical protein HN475_04750 [Piscirickettsiaceae bacterium]|jgi:hypothetical protein|nr:hypothetical protein [Piscirickettsiaceae bacterium]
MEKTGYLIFTEVGFIEAKEALLSASTTALWINPNILNTAQLDTLNKARVDTHILEQWVKPGDEKVTLNIIQKVEQHNPDINLLVEYL